MKLGLSEISDEASTIIVVGGDTALIKEDTMSRLLETKNQCDAKVAFFVAQQEQPAGYGRIVRDAEGSVVAIVEEADATDEQRNIQEVNTGVYAFDAQTLRNEILAVDSSNAQNEIYLTDVIASIREKFGAQSVATCEIDGQEVAGINDRVQLSEAESVMRKRLAHHWMKQGVTMLDPDHNIY